jgi:hypothetical protein
VGLRVVGCSEGVLVCGGRACACVCVCVGVIRVLGNRVRAKSSRGSQFWIGLRPFQAASWRWRPHQNAASLAPTSKTLRVWGGACQWCGRHKPRRPQAHDTRHWARSKVLGERRRREATSKKRARREVSAQRRSKLAGQALRHRLQLLPSPCNGCFECSPSVSS